MLPFYCQFNCVCQSQRKKVILMSGFHLSDGSVSDDLREGRGWKCSFGGASIFGRVLVENGSPGVVRARRKRASGLSRSSGASRRPGPPSPSLVFLTYPLLSSLLFIRFFLLPCLFVSYFSLFILSHFLPMPCFLLPCLLISFSLPAYPFLSSPRLFFLPFCLFLSFFSLFIFSSLLPIPFLPLPVYSLFLPILPSLLPSLILTLPYPPFVPSLF